MTLESKESIIQSFLMEYGVSERRNILMAWFWACEPCTSHLIEQGEKDDGWYDSVVGDDLSIYCILWTIIPSVMFKTSNEMHKY
jgi:hypothetical protein